jgi:hypothetical protein
MRRGKGVAVDDEAAVRFARKFRQDLCNVRIIPHCCRCQFHPKRSCGSFGVTDELADAQRHFGIEHVCDPKETGHARFEELHPFAGEGRLVWYEAGDIPTGPRQARDEAPANRIANNRKHDRDRSGFRSERRQCRRVTGEKDVGSQSDKLGSQFPHTLNIEIAPTIIDPDVASTDPPEFLKGLAERRDTQLPLPIAFSHLHQHADPPHSLRLLRPCRKRPRRRAAEERDELAPGRHSITSSARA